MSAHLRLVAPPPPTASDLAELLEGVAKDADEQFDIIAGNLSEIQDRIAFLRERISGARREAGRVKQGHAP